MPRVKRHLTSARKTRSKGKLVSYTKGGKPTSINLKTFNRVKRSF
jgi:hypothetical protein